MTKKKKPKKLRCGGSINTSNVNSAEKECITLTYAVKNVGNLLQAKKLIADMNGLHDEEEVTTTIEITDADSTSEMIDVKYKVKSCAGEAEAHIIKTEFDTFLKKKGGQTTLDEST